MCPIGSGNKLNSGKPLVLMALRVPLFPKEGRSGSAVVHNAQLKELRNQGFDVVMVNSSNFRGGVAQYPYIPMLFAPDAAARAQLPQDPSFIPFADFNIPVVDGLPSPLSSEYYSGLSDAQLGRSYAMWQWGMEWALLQYGIPDLVWHSHAEEHNGILAAVLPTVFTAHVNADSHSAREHRFDALRDFGLANVRTGFAISQTIAGQLGNPASGVYITPERVVMAPNGVNINVFNPNVNGSRTDLLQEYGDRLSGLREDDIWLVTAGRASNEKGFDTIIGALAEVRRNHLDGNKVHLIVIGSYGGERIFMQDPYTSKLVDPFTYRELAQKLGVADVVHFMGRMEQGQMARFYKAVVADGSVVLASRQEACPLVKPEVMAVGVPPLVTQIDGFEGIVANYPGNPNEIVRFAPPENPFGTQVLAPARLRLEQEGTAQARAALLVLNEVIEVDGQERFMLPESVVGLGSEASLYARSVLWEVAREQAVTALATAITEDLQESPATRVARGERAAEFANSNWSIGGSVRGIIPTLNSVMQGGGRAVFSLDVPASTDLHSLRQDRLDAIPVDTILQSAFAILRRAADQSTVAIGQAWRAFNVSVAVYMGTRSNFRHPFDPNAYGLHTPHTILEEVARAADVSVLEMRSTMQVVYETPTQNLVGAGRAHQMSPGAAPRGSHYFALLAQNAATGSDVSYRELVRVLSYNLNRPMSEIGEAFVNPEARPELAARIRGRLPDQMVVDASSLMRRIADHHFELGVEPERRVDDHDAERR